MLYCCVSFDPDHKSLYITDLDNRRIRKVDMKTNTVTTVAGNGQKVPKDGEDATKQPPADPAHAVDKDGNIWILNAAGTSPVWSMRKWKIRTVAAPERPAWELKALEAARTAPNTSASTATALC